MADESIEVALNLSGSFEPGINAAASATDALDSKIDGLSSSIDGIKISGIAKISSASKNGARALERVANEADDAAFEIESLGDRAEETGSSISEIGVGIAQGFGQAIFDKIKEAGEAIASFAIENQKASRDSRSLFKFLTKGEGDFENFTRVANKMGISVNDLVQSVAEFSDIEGVDINEAVDIAKFAEDMKAAGLQTELDKVVESIKAGEDPAKAMGKAIAEANERGIKVLGDGSYAAAEAATTLDGVMRKVKASVGDHLSAALGKGSAGFKSFLKQMQVVASHPAFLRGMRMIGKAIIGVVAAITASIMGLIALVGFIGDAWDATVAAVGPILSRFSSAVTSAWNTVVGAISSALGFISGIPGKIGAALGGAVSAVSSGVSQMASSIGSLPGKFLQAGIDAVKGLINGIKGMAASAAAAASNLASSVASGLTNALNMNSPSKLFEEYGKFTVQGYNQGIEKEADPGVVGAMVPSPAEARRELAVDAPAGNTTNNSNNAEITINVNGGDAQSIAMAIREEIDRYYSGVAMAQGAV